MARIDAPLLDNLLVTFCYQPISYSPWLIQFINCTPELKAHDQARVVFDPVFDAWINLRQTFAGKLCLRIVSRPPNQLSSLAQVCSSSFPRAFIPAVERLYILKGVSRLRWKGNIENSSHPMAGTFTSIYRREGSPHIMGICTAYHICPARTCRRKSDGGATRPERSFLRDTPIWADLESY